MGGYTQSLQQRMPLRWLSDPSNLPLPMNITLPGDLEQKLDPAQVRVDLAVGMYAAKRITLGRAAEIAGLTQMQFQRELASRKVPLHYDLDDLKTDVMAVRELSKS